MSDAFVSASAFLRPADCLLLVFLVFVAGRRCSGIVASNKNSLVAYLHLISSQQGECVPCLVCLAISLSTFWVCFCLRADTGHLRLPLLRQCRAVVLRVHLVLLSFQLIPSPPPPLSPSPALPPPPHPCFPYLTRKARTPSKQLPRNATNARYSLAAGLRWTGISGVLCLLSSLAQSMPKRCHCSWRAAR